MTELPVHLSIATTRAADGWPRKAWTHHDLDRMAAAGLLGPDEHVELIDGEIVPMPAKGRRHERVRDALNVWLWDHLGRDKKVLSEPGWRPAERYYLEPDFLILPRTVVPPEFPGSDALLAIEIADSSLAFDTTIKRDLYALLGVREYWVIHAWELTTRAHHGLAASGYMAVEDRPPSATLRPLLVPELALQLEGLRLDAP